MSNRENPISMPGLAFWFHAQFSVKDKMNVVEAALWTGKIFDKIRRYPFPSLENIFPFPGERRVAEDLLFVGIIAVEELLNFKQVILTPQPDSVETSLNVLYQAKKTELFWPRAINRSIRTRRDLWKNLFHAGYNRALNHKIYIVPAITQIMTAANNLIAMEPPTGRENKWSPIIDASLPETWQDYC